MKKYTLVELKDRRREQEPNDGNPLRVHFVGIDLCDYYVVYENCEAKDEPGSKRYAAIFFTEDDLENPHELYYFDTMIEAMLHLSMRFVIDNEETADTRHEAIETQHLNLHNALAKLTPNYVF